ncbi:MAG TPA: FAD-dependent oxidoreductase [Ktedonobacterales bacterium]|nr:FAD-dependent oxidoreductase [Ktedonobacterales bacterium]
MASDQLEPQASPVSHERATCCIIGGGPAGMLLAYLLARQGVSVILLEAHMDFDREFRGDSLHPNTLEIMDELGLSERLLKLPHTQLSGFTLQTETGPVSISLARLKTRHPYVTFIPQAVFLDFIAKEAQRFPQFRLLMGAQVVELIEEDGVIRGVRYQSHSGAGEVRADLTVGADGRFSKARKLAGFEPVAMAAPLDILWFRLTRRPDDQLNDLGGRFFRRRIIVIINRFSYWQIGYVIPKGGYQAVRAAGLEAFRDTVARAIPELADRCQELQEWKQISVLSVESSYLTRWYRPGLLLIGDAAHVMSPVGGVGVNYAIQDAVETANLLGPKLKAGAVQPSDLAAVQRRRAFPTRVIQRFQVFLQRFIFQDGDVSASDAPFAVPAVVRWALATPLGVIPARLLAFGVRPAHIQRGVSD